MKRTKSTIPKALRAEMETDPEYQTCALYGQFDHDCLGRITREHTIIYQGRSLQERWSIIPLCAKGHDVDEFQDSHNMNKELNVWVALNRAADDELRAISKAVNYIHRRDYLNSKYGVYVRKTPLNAPLPKINY